MVRLKILLILATLTLSSCSTVSYLVQAGLGQWALYNHERPIEEVIKDSRTKPQVRAMLSEIAPIRKFVEDELSVKSTSNYTTYVDLKRPYVVWALIAADPFEVKAQEWSFPLVGSFPYIGFFKEDMARKWGDEEKAKGRDIYIRGVAAYSTLGYLRDPLLSSMLTPNKEDLANLLFHETTHSIIYVNGEGGFNEQVASFIGDYGELTYIRKTYGENSEKHREWLAAREDRKTFGRVLREFESQLKLHYESTKGLDATERASQKESRFAAFRVRIAADGIWKSAQWKKYALERLSKSMVNNAVVVAHLTYEDNQDVFESVWQKSGQNVKAALAILQEFVASKPKSEPGKLVPVFKEWLTRK